jgi:hypothetical protein
MIDYLKDEMFDSVHTFIAQHGLNDMSSLHLNSFRDKLLCVRSREIPHMVPFLKPFHIDMTVELIDPEKLAQAEKLRTHILQMMDRETETVRTMIQGATQIKQSARRKIIEHYDGSREALQELVVGLMRRLLVNFQPGTKRLIENLLLIYNLKTDPHLLSEIAGGTTASFQAMHVLLGPMIKITSWDWLARHFSTEIKLKIEKDLGIVLDAAILGGNGVFRLADMILEEACLGRELLESKCILSKCIEDDSMIETGISISISMLPVKAARPMVFLKGFYREYRVMLESSMDVEADEQGLYVGIIRPEERTSVLSKVVVQHGGFRCDAGQNEPSNSLAISILNYIVRMDDNAIGRIRKTVHYLERIYHELFESTRELKLASSLADSIIGMEGVTHLDFVPEKNVSLFFRALAGGDCSIDLDSQVTHQRSAFYKIIQGSEWIGYVTLLDLCDGAGRHAMLIDVMNMRKDLRIDYLALFDLFVENIRSFVEPMGYCYVLIPNEMTKLSNNEFIRDPVFWQYGKGNIISGFTLDPFEGSFHTSGSEEYIVVRDFSSHGQLLLFDG